MKVMFFKIIITIIVLLVGGCAGGPVGYGGSYQIGYADEYRILFEYDSDLISIKRLMSVAKEHCARFGKHAVPNTSGPTNWNAVGTFSADCIESKKRDAR